MPASVALAKVAVLLKPGRRVELAQFQRSNLRHLGAPFTKQGLKDCKYHPENYENNRNNK